MFLSLSRINAVETLYAAFPALMYLDPTLGTPLLEPLFRLQASPDHGVKFAAGDLGMSHRARCKNTYIMFYRVELSQCLHEQFNAQSRS
jgi:hypothetical protein